MMLRLVVLLARQLPERSWRKRTPRPFCLALTIIVDPRATASRAAASSPMGLDPVRDRGPLELVLVIEMLLLPVVAPAAAAAAVVMVVVGWVAVGSGEASAILVLILVLVVLAGLTGLAVVVVVVET